MSSFRVKREGVVLSDCKVMTPSLASRAVTFAHRNLLRASQRVQSSLLHSWRIDSPTPYECEILSDLNAEGVHVTTVDRLLPDSADAKRRLLAVATRVLSSEFRARTPLWVRGECSTDLTAEALIAHAPEVYLLGLQEPLLRLVRIYLRLPVAYHGAVLRHSLVDGNPVGPRQWHQDAEDFHVFRMVVYLNDVASGGGPFEYIPRSSGLSYRHFAGLDGELSNERMKTVLAEDKWKRVAGPAGTVVLCDTANVFHHESLQTERERSVVMIGYSSRHPKSMELAMAHFPVERVKAALRNIVPTHQYPHVFGWRKTQ